MNRPDAPLFDSSPRNLGNPVVFDAQNQRSKSSAAESARRYSLFKGGLLAVGVVFGIGVVSSFLTRNTDAGVPIANVGEQIGRVQNVFESSHFETKDEAKPVRIKIHVHGDDEIQVRNDSVLGDKAILGITKPGLVVTGIEGTGIFYLNDEHRTTEDGEKKVYGIGSTRFQYLRKLAMSISQN